MGASALVSCSRRWRKQSLERTILLLPDSGMICSELLAFY